MNIHDPIDVSILIVSHNTRTLTEVALSSIHAETRDVTYETIVVDNASSDGSAVMIAAHPLKPRLLTLEENIGFARANNLAAREARGRYLLLLNPDTVILDRAVERLVAFARERPEARIWGGRSLFADGRLNLASCWGRMTPWRLFCRASGLAALFPDSDAFNGEAIGGWRRDSVRQVDIVSGCFFLIETALWRELRGFDPQFFMYGEDADLCLRAEALSARPVITPTATIIHHGGASERVRADKMVRLLAAKASLIKHHWKPGYEAFGCTLLAAWPFSRAAATTLAAAVARTPSLMETARTWRIVCARRREWRDGYAAKGSENTSRPETLTTMSERAA
ncbi:MAG: glycosyltransferase family 2 protein [Hyphomicrobium sp.]